jgi:trans-AT polyketide synthase/acyltransferase/oxidoreductase domain-containing protein
MMHAAIFPGQGSQKPGMGGRLFDAHADLVARADEILGYSIRTLCLEDPHARLGRTLYTQPALFVVNALHFLDARGRSPAPAIAAGHSLGEYNALWAADVFDFETGLRLVRRRAELMDQAAGGGMAAVVGLDVDAVTRVLAEHSGDALDLANLNEPTQTVLSGPRAEIERFKPIFEARGVRLYTILNVSAAFHSRYMEPARRAFAAALAEVTLHPPRIPVVANCTARPHEDGDIARLLADQIVMPVRWAASVEAMLQRGATVFEEHGPGKVLTGMVARIRQTWAPRSQGPAAQPATTPARDERPAPVAPSSPSPARVDQVTISAAQLGSAEFRRAHGVRYAYLTGAMYKGIASAELVARVGEAGLLGFLGCGGMRLDAIADAIDEIQQRVGRDGNHGVNLLAHPDDPRRELDEVALFLAKGVRTVEAAAFIQVSPALVWFRLRGVRRDASGRVVAPHRVVAKVSRPEIARAFLEPAPPSLVDRLVLEGRLTRDEAALAHAVPLSHDLCVEADSGGHTDMGSLPTLLPAIRRLRDEAMARHGYAEGIRVGAAGGIGTPDAALAAFMLGADFILTGSINQCTPEAGTSERVKGHPAGPRRRRHRLRPRRRHVRARLARPGRPQGPAVRRPRQQAPRPLAHARPPRGHRPRDPAADPGRLLPPQLRRRRRRDARLVRRAPPRAARPRRGQPEAAHGDAVQVVFRPLEPARPPRRPRPRRRLPDPLRPGDGRVQRVGPRHRPRALARAPGRRDRRAPDDRDRRAARPPPVRAAAVSRRVSARPAVGEASAIGRRQRCCCSGVPYGPTAVVAMIAMNSVNARPASP